MQIIVEICETCRNQHGLLSTSIGCFIIFLGARLHGGSLPEVEIRSSQLGANNT